LRFNAGGQWQPGLPLDNDKIKIGHFQENYKMPRPWLPNALPMLYGSVALQITTLNLSKSWFEFLLTLPEYFSFNVLEACETYVDGNGKVYQK